MLTCLAINCIKQRGVGWGGPTPHAEPAGASRGHPPLEVPMLSQKVTPAAKRNAGGKM